MKWKLMRFKRFLNISRKVSFQFPIWKLPELRGEGLLTFSTRSSWDLLLLWICPQEPTEGLFPDVFPPAFPTVAAISTGQCGVWIPSRGWGWVGAIAFLAPADWQRWAAPACAVGRAAWRLQRVPGSTLGCRSLLAPFTFLAQAPRIIVVDVPTILLVVCVHILRTTSVLDLLQFQLRLRLLLSSEAIFACKQLWVQLETTFFPERYFHLLFNSHASSPDEKRFLGHLVRPMSVPCLQDRSSPMTGLSHFRLN